MRLRTDIFIAALIRRAAASGAFATLVRRGADEAGAIFVLVDRLDGAFDLFGPAPQSLLAEGPPGERLFAPLLAAAPEAEVSERMRRERDFDPDLWLVEIADRDGRSFIEVARDEE